MNNKNLATKLKLWKKISLFQLALTTGTDLEKIKRNKEEYVPTDIQKKEVVIKQSNAEEIFSNYKLPIAYNN